MTGLPHARLTGVGLHHDIRSLTTPVVLGRRSADAETDAGVDLVVVGSSQTTLVSRRHVTITHAKAGEWVFACEGKNGVRINGEFFRRGDAGPLTHGSTLVLAGQELLFQTSAGLAQRKSEFPAAAPGLRKAEQHASPSEEEATAAALAALTGFGARVGSSSPGARMANRATSHGGDDDNGEEDEGEEENDEEDDEGEEENNGDEDGPEEDNAGGVDEAEGESEGEDAAMSEASSGRGPSAAVVPLPNGASIKARNVGMPGTKAAALPLAAATAAVGPKQEKPGFSYAALIAQAITSSPQGKMTLARIYAWIREQYPFYRTTESSWQNSIRHNLSLNKCFVKLPRKENEPGKGCFWSIDPAVSDVLLASMYKRRLSKRVKAVHHTITEVPYTALAGASASVTANAAHAAAAAAAAVAAVAGAGSGRSMPPPQQLLPPHHPANLERTVYMHVMQAMQVLYAEHHVAQQRLGQVQFRELRTLELQLMEQKASPEAFQAQLSALRGKQQMEMQALVHQQQAEAEFYQPRVYEHVWRTIYMGAPGGPAGPGGLPFMASAVPGGAPSAMLNPLLALGPNPPPVMNMQPPPRYYTGAGGEADVPMIPTPPLNDSEPSTPDAQCPQLPAKRKRGSEVPRSDGTGFSDDEPAMDDEAGRSFKKLKQSPPPPPAAPLLQTPSTITM